MSILAYLSDEETKPFADVMGQEAYGSSVQPTTGQILSDQFGTSWGNFKSYIDMQRSRMDDKPITYEEFVEGGYDPNVKWHKNMTSREASILSDIKKEEAYKERNWRNATSLQKIAGFGAGIADSFTDPINIATAFIPVLGVSSKLATLAKSSTSAIGRAGARGAQGFVQGAVGSAYAEPLYIGMMDELQIDYDFADSLLNVAMGGFVGSGLHVGIGALKDRASARVTPDATAQATKLALEQIQEGRPVDVTPIIEESDINVRAKELEGELNKKLEEIEAEQRQIQEKAKEAATKPSEEIFQTKEPPASRESTLGKLKGNGTAARYTDYKINNRDMFYLEGMHYDLMHSDSGHRVFIDNINDSGVTVVGAKATTPDWFQEWNKNVTRDNKERMKEKKKNQTRESDKQREIPLSQSILTRDKVTHVLEKMQEGKPLGKREGEIAIGLLEIARNIRSDEIGQKLNYRLSREQSYLQDRKAQMGQDNAKFAEQQSKPHIDTDEKSMLDEIDDFFNDGTDFLISPQDEMDILMKELDELEAQGYLTKEQIEERAAIEAEGKTEEQYNKAFKAAAYCMIRSVTNVV